MFNLSSARKPENAEKVTELFVKWKPPEGFKILCGPYTVLGANKSVSMVELTGEAIAKADRYWRHICTTETYPLMGSVVICQNKSPNNLDIRK